MRAAPLLVLLAACTELPDIDRGRCGNGVVEPELGEDCDRADGTCGAADTPAACRLLCGGDGAEGGCPSGSRCGLDNVCHAPGGWLYVATEAPWTSRQLLVGDTNGDRYPELIGVGDTQFDLRLGGPDGTFAASLVSPNLAVVGSPHLANLDGDDLADVLVPVGIGLFTLLGDAVSSLQPIFQDSFALPGIGAMSASSVSYREGGLGPGSVERTQLLAAFALPEGPSCMLSGGCPILLLGDAGAPLPPGRRPEQLAGDGIAWARRLDQPEGSLVVALAFRDDPGTPGDDGGVFLYHGDAAAPSLTGVGQISGVPGEIDRGVWFADLDRDGRGDLVMSTRGGPFGEALVVAWARTDGGFEPPGYLVGGPGPLRATTAALAWSDLDGDGDADMIADPGIYSTSCLSRSCSFTAASSLGRGWAAAAVGDLNGDGRRDVVGVPRTGVTLDVLLGTGSEGFWNEAPLPAPGAVSRVRTGDFDGNGIADVAIVAGPDGITGADQVYVSFGRANQPPATATFQGFVGEVLALDRAQVPVPGRADTIDDLLVVARRPDSRGIQVVLGSTSQRLAAPLIPPALVSDGLSFVLASLPVSLDGDGYDDLVTLFIELDADGGVAGFTVRVYGGGPGGALHERTAPGGLPVDAGIFMLGDAQWTALSSPGATEATLVGVDAASRTVALTVGCDGSGCTLRDAEVMLDGGEVGPLGALRSADVDGDGDLDVLAAYREGIDGDLRPASARVWLNDGGRVGASRVVAVPAGVSLVDVAAADLDLDGASTLFFIGREPGRTQIFSAAPDGGGGWSEPTPDPQFDASFNVEAAQLLHAGDLDGDGLPDVAMVSGNDRATPRALTVFLQAESIGALAEGSRAADP